MSKDTLMISDTAKHCRLITVTPTDDLVRQRDLAAVELEAEISAMSASQICVALDLSLGSPVRKGTDGQTVLSRVLEAIHKQQASFVRDASESSLDARLTIALALGRVMAKNDSDRADAIAHGLLCAVEFGAPSGERYSAELNADLYAAASEWLSKESETQRNPPNAALEVKGTDIASLATSMTAALRAMEQSFEEKRSIDREELDILWWCHGRRSTTRSKLFSELPPADAAIIAAIEAHNLSNLPRLPSIINAASSVVAAESARLDEWVSGCAEDILDTACDIEAFELCEKHPRLLPLTFALQRRRSSENWAAEFEKATGIPIDRATKSSEIVRQLVRELSFRESLGAIDD